MLITLAKAGDVPDLFSKGRPERGVTETATALGMTRSSARDLVSALTATGLLGHSGGHGFRLGWKALGGIALVSAAGRAAARPIVGALASVGALDDELTRVRHRGVALDHQGAAISVNVPAQLDECPRSHRLRRTASPKPVPAR